VNILRTTTSFFSLESSHFPFEILLLYQTFPLGPFFLTPNFRKKTPLFNGSLVSTRMEHRYFDSNGSLSVRRESLLLFFPVMRHLIYNTGQVRLLHLHLRAVATRRRKFSSFPCTISDQPFPSFHFIASIPLKMPLPLFLQIQVYIVPDIAIRHS